jgi:hypothetical protein
MRLILLGFAASIAACLATTPAAAGGSNGFGGGNGALPDRSFPINFGGSGFDGHHDGHHGDNNGGIWVNGGEWARYNNQSWSSDGFNDWWHDRPDRAYPAWMRNNQDCQRQWYAGSTLRC